ncbi:MAG TPA: hypothetical protein VF179_31480 [Thermoanaerobaculia bacterium]|nr:hypothetical protein [Thermoanaerobaculia bacterium]
MMKRAVLVLVMAAVLVVAFIYLRRQVQIDDCLDGGGRWDYTNQRCDS